MNAQISSDDAVINSTLQACGFTNISKITSTLQGSIWNVTDLFKSAKVVKVTDKHLAKYGISRHENTANIDENILSEKSILKFLSSQPDCPKSVVKYDRFFEIGNYYFLVMQHGGRSLFEFIVKAHKLIKKGLIEIKEWHKVIKHIFNQMIECIEWIHSKNIVHFDVSMENILINDVSIIETKDPRTGATKIQFVSDDLQIKFCDFGLAHQFSENENFMCSFYNRGKTNYKSPEINERKEYFNAKSNDVWCCGVVLYMMSVGSSPFKMAHKTDGLFAALMNRQLRQLLSSWNMVHYVDQNWINLMESFFQYEQNRICVKNIKQHPWTSN